MSEWEEQLSSKGLTYYYNKNTGESRWKNPEKDDLPDSKFWIELVDEDNHTYYFNTKTKESKWKKPDDFDDEAYKSYKLEQERQGFFKMMNRSVQRDLNPISQSTPAIYTLKELSVRFDTDPCLINTSPNHRERFMDEWLTLERKRRVELEKRMVAQLKEKVSNRLHDMAKQGQITIKTKWDDVVTLLRLDPNWKLLLNYDRIQVFTKLMQFLYAQHEYEYAEERSKRLKTEAENRNRFEEALRALLKGQDLSNATYKDYQKEIENLPEYHGIITNIYGSTAEDLFYNAVDEFNEQFEHIAFSINFDKEDVEYDHFIQKHSDKLKQLTENAKQYVYNFCLFQYLSGSVINAKQKEDNEKALLRKLKLSPALVDCTSYEAAAELLHDTPEFNSIESDEERKEIFRKFVEWSTSRNCEPGEILEGDSDWEDISSFFENEVKKSTITKY